MIQTIAIYNNKIKTWQKNTHISKVLEQCTPTTNGYNCMQLKQHWVYNSYILKQLGN